MCWKNCFNYADNSQLDNQIVKKLNDASNYSKDVESILVQNGTLKKENLDILSMPTDEKRPPKQLFDYYKNFERSCG